MKSFIYAVAIFMFVAVLSTQSFAFENSVELNYYTGSGDVSITGETVKPDLDMDSLALSYTHYFKDVTSGDSLLGERVFLQHPSSVHFDYSSADLEMDVTGTTITVEGTYFSLGGTYYFNDTTGVSLSLTDSDLNSETDVTGNPKEKFETTGTTIGLAVTHYIQENVALTLGYATTGGDEDETTAGVTDPARDIDSTLIILGVAALVENFKIDFNYATGDETEDTTPGLPDVDTDIETIGIGLGYYTAKNNKVFLSLNTSERSSSEGSDKWTVDIDEMKIGDRYYVNEDMHISLAYYTIGATYREGAIEIDEDIAGFELGVGYEF